MATSLMIDNWTLQDVENVLSGGVDDSKVGEMVISSDRQSHEFSPVFEAAVQIDALLTLLTNIVCFDSLHIDHGFVDTWKRDTGRLSPLENLEVLKAVDYSANGDQVAQLRKVILDELCVTPSLSSSMQKIQDEWAESRRASDPHLSALVWGSAGMLARSHATAIPYYGHPLRRRLIAETRMFLPKNSAVEKLEAFVRTKRIKMFRFRAEQLSGTLSQLVLPPIAVNIIEESSNIEDLIPIALQVRDQNVALRAWLSDFQSAIDVEDERKQIKFESTLASVARSMEAKYGADKSGSVGLSLSTAFIKLDVQRSLVDTIRNSVGIRATLSKLILTSRGQTAIEKLLAMMGVARTTFGRDVTTALRGRYAS